LKGRLQDKNVTNPDVWDAKKVGEFLNISLPSVYAGAKNGSIPCIVIGEKIYRFSAEKITNLFNFAVMVPQCDTNKAALKK
jgi:hypothetical protein